jgi:hypothetical protein
MAGGEESLVATVMLAKQLTVAHLDSCATHCFVNSATSKQLTERGYPALQSPILFDVHQGNPLCVTSTIHLLPLSIVRDDGSVCAWKQCLFLVADAGAPVIICYAALRLGGIIKYKPPAAYERLLEESEKREQGDLTVAINLEDLLEQPYRAPTRVAAALQTAARLPVASELDPLKQGINEPKTCSQISLNTSADSGGSLDPPKSPVNGPNRIIQWCAVLATKTSVNKGGNATNRPKRKGDTDMLTEENPYGKNPPLPEVVMEAVRHLKLLSNPNTTPVYSEQQQQELTSTLGALRPAWANCLTLQQTLNTADRETEKFIQELMDKPTYQTSIFALNPKTCCDLREYEINQKPGRDLWTPAQPRRFKNPATHIVVDAWLDALLDNNRCRESMATHPAPVTVVEREGKEPRVCVDYRNRNSRTEVPVFPMPNVNDFLDDNAGFKYYCSFDMKSMFNQFAIKEEHRHLAAFITNRGVFEPNVVMFGLQGGPQHAVRECGGAMATDPLTNGKTFTEWALQQNALGVRPPYEMCPSTKVIKGSRLRPFIDDVTIPSNHEEGMKKLVELFFEFCSKHNLVLKKKESSNNEKSPTYAGICGEQPRKTSGPTKDHRST